MTAYIISVVGKKGGQTKSTFARAIAVSYAKAGWNTLIADMDAGQGTTINWQSRRLENGFKPEVSVQQFTRIDQVAPLTDKYQLIVYDGLAKASALTLDIAKSADLVMLPTGISLDDLEPTVKLAHELKKNGISISKMTVGLSRVGNSNIEIQEAREYIQEAGYHVLDGAIPEKVGYRRAQDAGRAITETQFSTLNKAAQEVINSIDTRFNELIN